MSSNNIGGEGSASGLPRSSGAAYTDPQNTNFGYFNATGQILLGPRALAPQDFSGVSSQYVSPASVQTFPIRPGGDASQITANTRAKALFNSLNAQSQQVSAGKRQIQYPMFASQQDRIRYVQAQYSQPIPGTTASPTYSVNSLFSPYLPNTRPPGN